MAEKIKGITIEFRGNATPLQKAIREVNSDLNKTTKELSQVNNSIRRASIYGSRNRSS